MAVEILQEFLDYYVLGAPFPSDEKPTFRGIRRRQPALVSASPDFEPFALGGDLSGSAVDPEVLGTELKKLPPDLAARCERGVLLDVCALERARAKVVGRTCSLELVWASSYPEPEIVPSGSDRVRVFPLGGDGQPTLVAGELMQRISQFLGNDSNGLTWSVEIETVPFEQIGER